MTGTIAGACIGFMVGLLIGITGIGGGSLMTPTLIFLGVEPLIAIGTDLLYATVSRILGVIILGRYGHVRVDIIWRLLAGSIPAVLIGGLILRFSPKDLLDSMVSILLGLVLVMIGFLGITRRDISFIKPRRNHAFLVGLLVGLIVQFTSVGAGALVGFALVNVARIDPREAVGTVLSYGLVLSTLSLYNYVSLGLMDLRLAVTLLVGGIPGVILGVYGSTIIPGRVLRTIINIIILIIGVIIISSILL